MASALYIPDANPIRFWKQGAVLDYAQKYSPSDYTNLQCVSVGSRVYPVLVVEYADGTSFKTLTPAEPVVLAGNYYFYTFAIEFTGYLGCYRMFLFDGSTAEPYESSLIEVSPEHEVLPILRYRNTRNKDDINYAAVEIFSLRLEGGFLPKNYRPHSDDVVYQDQTVNFELLHSDTYHSRIFSAGEDVGIPDWLHYIVHKAWGNDTVFVGNDGYVKYEEAEWSASGEEAYDWRTWTLEVIATGETWTRDPDIVVTWAWNDYVCRTQLGANTGYAAAAAINIIRTTAGGSVIDQKTYSILAGFVYNDVVYQQLTEGAYAALPINAVLQRGSAFISYVESVEGALSGIHDMSELPFNLVSKEYNLIAGEYNLITTLAVPAGFIVDAGDACADTGILYAGGRAAGVPPQTEAEVKAVATIPPVTEPSPFVLPMPVKGDEFDFAAPIGSLNVSITLHESLGKPDEIYDYNQGYDIADQFELAPASIIVDGATCNVYSYTGLVPFAGAMELRVKI